jgi:hypothetical protein
MRIGSYFMGTLKYHSEGSSCHVSFDWAKAAGGMVLGFYHSHPSGITSPSSRDDRTMKAWVISEGRPMVCGIFCDGKQKAFLYYGKGKDFTCEQMVSHINGNIFFARWAKGNTCLKREGEFTLLRRKMG